MTADFLTRLAERTLGLAPVAQPLIAPMFAPGPLAGAVARSPSEDPAVSADVPWITSEMPSLPVGATGRSPSDTQPIPLVSRSGLSPIGHQGLLDETQPPPPLPVGAAKRPPPNATEATPLRTAPEGATGPQTPSTPLAVAQQARSGLPPPVGATGRSPSDVQQATPFPTTLESVTEHQAPSTPPGIRVRPARGTGRPPSRSGRPAIPVAALESRSPPTVRVTIGRIEVQAMVPPSPPAPRAGPERRAPVLPLGDYLKERDAGKR